MFVECVRTITGRTQTIKRWYPKGGGEITIRSTARTPFGKSMSQLGRYLTRRLVQAHDRIGALQRRTIDASRDLE